MYRDQFYFLHVLSVDKFQYIWGSEGVSMDFSEIDVAMVPSMDVIIMLLFIVKSDISRLRTIYHS